MSLGPLMLDLQGTTLKAEEAEWLQHPQVGGVILFARNFASPQQLLELTQSIHALRQPHPIIAVDQEGGRVQRFHQGFTTLPAMAKLGESYQQNPQQTLRVAEQLGWLLAAELLACQIDISFAPVLDIAHGVSGVIGDRALHRSPEVVANLGQAIVRGMHKAGMAATGKHFPGHGGVREDSHIARPVDQRPLADLQLNDMLPFGRLIDNGLAGIMPAHVIYPHVDNYPAGYSRIWLQDILRTQLGFQGVIFSDDLSMQAADTDLSYAERAWAALTAGCDMILLCNQPDAVPAVLAALADYNNPASQIRLARMHGRFDTTLQDLQQTQQWQQAKLLIEQLMHNTTLELDV